ncbi:MULTISPECIES: prepilin peptidase [unclassified Sedimentibacter]|uniref:prepilin peptidase n=1 Tax=unclassified Sedimentibacter TaxID=2649220 RepID=UPI0027DFFA04|nr:A24 family peptidase [Sedimentibacter sp. MB35-C1]WMJ76673.1 prepilin peptidase [Sedimentibacter sp. MB35-C1]
MTLIFLIYGLFIGSFLNVCIFRIPSGISIVKPPSSCGSCGHRLNYIDMIPVFNYIINRGRCRYCGASYSIQYPVIELLNGLLYALTYLKFGLTVNSILCCAMISILITVSMIDMKYKIIPDSLNIAGAMAGIIFILVNKTYLTGIIGALTGFGLFAAIAILTNAMGGGDIKLMAALGLMFGLKGTLFITLFSFVIGAVVSVFLIALNIKGRKDEIPFGPFISLSALIYIFFGFEIIRSYLSLFM